MRDTLGSFSLVFLLYAIVPAVVMVGIFVMRPPAHHGVEETEDIAPKKSPPFDEPLTAPTAAQ